MAAAKHKKKRNPETPPPEPGEAFEDAHEEGDTVDVRERHELEHQIEQMALERDNALAARQRALADYANFQRRAADNEERARRETAARVIRALLPVLDHFDLALHQKLEDVSVEQLAGGVQIVREELVRALENQGVSRIAPEPGEEFNPSYHEAMMPQPSEDIPPNHIVATLQPGYALGQVVLRPAKVTVAPGNED